MSSRAMNIADKSLSIPITHADRAIAEKFANLYAKFPNKMEQVFYNTLAVCAVDNYLRPLGIATDTSRNNSWHTAIRLFENVADLFLTGIGRLECRPLKPNETSCHIPVEVWTDRIGYVVVQIDSSFKKANLIGFVKSVTSEELPRNQLQPIDALLDTIGELEIATVQVEQSGVESTSTSPKVWERIRQWIAQSADQGWQTFDLVFGTPQLQPALNVRSSHDSIDTLIELIRHSQDELIRRQSAGVLGSIGFGDADAIQALTELIETTENAETRWQAASSLKKIDPDNQKASERGAKVLDFGMELGGQAIALIIALMPTKDERIQVYFQVRSTDNQLKLPPNLKLGILSESDEVLKEIASRADINGEGQDQSIQMQFRMLPGKPFRVRVTLDDVTVTEDIVI